MLWVLIVVVFYSFDLYVDAETALYTELWHACAGPLVTVPRERERVFYFPQGHIEQVGFQILYSTNDVLASAHIVSNSFIFFHFLPFSMALPLGAGAFNGVDE